MERSEVDCRAESWVVPEEGQSRWRGQRSIPGQGHRSFPRKVNLVGEVRGRHGPKPGSHEAEALSMLEAFTLFTLEAEAWSIDL